MIRGRAGVINFSVLIKPLMKKEERLGVPDSWIDEENMDRLWGGELIDG